MGNESLADIFRAYQLTSDSNENFKTFAAAVGSSDLLIICSPLYVDALPASATLVLEMLAGDGHKDLLKNKLFFSIIHSGYPEPHQREVCLEICRLFAVQVNMKWLGGIGFGLTSIINGKRLSEMGRTTKWMRAALDQSTEALMFGREAPHSAAVFSNKRAVPLPIPILKSLVNLRIKRQAEKIGIQDLNCRPYI